jgi:hypothetical protein
MFVRRRQGQGWHNDPSDLGELNGFIRGQFDINETKDRHDHQPFQHFQYPEGGKRRQR